MSEGRREGGREGGGGREGESFNRSCGAAHHLQYYICGPIMAADSVVRERGREAKGE